MESTNNNRIRIKDQEIFKIKLALSSLTNTVVVCPVIATLYTQSPTDEETWKYCKRGAPGLIVTHGDEDSIACLQLCIADPDSGFALWRETLQKTSDYKASQKNFHTFRLLSGGKDSMAGIRFPTDDSASMLLHEVLSTISKCGESHPDSPNREKRRSTRKIRKDEISTPCMFKHVTSSGSNKTRERAKSTSILKEKRGKGSKYSGSGSSLDAPDSDPVHDLATRRTLSLKKR